MTITQDQRDAIARKLAGMHLPAGVGTEDQACSIAAINLALTGELTDRIPGCMSEVIGRWIIIVQDAMPDAMRNSAGWKNLLPLAAGTGREQEPERAAMILDWVVDGPLVSLQTLADDAGFGDTWRTMCEAERPWKAAEAAWAAWAARAAEAARAARAAWAAWAARAAEAERAWSEYNPPALLAQLIAVGS